MRGAAFDLLKAIRCHGGDVKIIAPDRLKVSAPPDLLPDFVKRVRAVKPELLLTLSAATVAAKAKEHIKTTAPRDAVWWRRRFAMRTFQWSLGDRGWDEAKELAWGDLQNEWHSMHGRRWPTWECAACGAPIGGVKSLDLPDGNRVHLEPIDCLIMFGRRWRRQVLHL